MKKMKYLIPGEFITLIVLATVHNVSDLRDDAQPFFHQVTVSQTRH